MLDIEPTPPSTSTLRDLNIALLCDYGKGVAGTIIDHIEGIVRYSAHNVIPINFRRHLPAKLDLDRFDGVAIHYSLVACSDNYLAPETRTAIRNFSGLKIAFVQDDYRFIDDTVRAFRAMRIHVLFGLAPEDIIDDVYAPAALPGVRRETVLAGYVPENLLDLDVPPLRDRSLDIGYRARKLPAWLGSHAQEKWQIAAGVMRDADRHDLRCDISCDEGDRIYGDKWIEFLTNSKAVLGTESGASVCDFTGEIQTAVEAHTSKAPDTSFETLQELYFKDEDRRLMMNIISPRCFEAAALRTLMILYEGNYSGRLKPWKHYLPLQKDHGNMADVVSVLRDPDKAQEIVDRAYQEVALNRDNWFSSMVKQMDSAIEATFQPEMQSANIFYTVRELSRISRQTTKRARKGYQLRELHVMLHVRAVRTLDALLGLLPEGLRQWIRGGLQRQFHRLRRVVHLVRDFRRQFHLLKSSGQSVSALLNSHIRTLLHVSKEVGAEQDVRDVLLLQSASSKIKNSAVHLTYDADNRHCRIELVEQDEDRGRLGPAETISPHTLGQLIKQGKVEHFVYRCAEDFAGIDQSLADDKSFSGLASIANVKPDAIVSLMAHVCERQR